jgi:RNA polymerase sigma factor (sigma-70 family)
LLHKTHAVAGKPRFAPQFYWKTALGYPPLSGEDERALANFAQKGVESPETARLGIRTRESARERLALSAADHIKNCIASDTVLGVVIRHGMDKLDLFQAGFVGSLQAADRFDPKKDKRFGAYAYPYIYGKIMKEIKGDSDVTVPRGDYNRFEAVEDAIQFLNKHGFAPSGADVEELMKTSKTTTVFVIRMLSSDEEKTSLMAEHAEMREALDVVRKGERIPAEVAAEDPLTEMLLAHGSEQETLGGLARRRLAERLLEGTPNLTRGERDLMRLFYEDNTLETFSDVAKRLDVSRNAPHLQKNRAIRKMRKSAEHAGLAEDYY